MTEPETPFSRKHLKALFKTLVREVGKQDAAAEFLGVSPQRVSQLANIKNDEMAREIPTWEQVWRLEAELGRSIVFAGLAASIGPACLAADANATTETHQLLQAVAALCPLAAAYDPAKPETVAAFNEGFNRVQREAADVQAIASTVVSIRSA
jgi:DNA-binding transcriptional regulator YdaS (Cro superfamily)